MTSIWTMWKTYAKKPKHIDYNRQIMNIEYFIIYVNIPRDFSLQKGAELFNSHRVPFNTPK